jgi:hypothetical protein
MIKVGDKAKGFRFETSSGTNRLSRYFGVHWNPQMEKFIGVEGIVKGVRPEINELVISFMVTTTNVTELHWQHWTYPLDEYLVLQREQRLNEIGI